MTARVKAVTETAAHATPFVMAAGDNVVDCYEGTGVMYPGGNCVNVSVFARRSGARTAYLGQIGDDDAGRHIRRSLDAEGVDTRLLRVVPGGRTASCLVGLRDRERVFLASDQGVSMFTPTAAELAEVAEADAVHIGSTSGLDDWVAALAHRARVSYDFAIRREPEHIDRIAPHTYLATFSGGDLSEVQAHALGGRAIAAGSDWALVTRGPAGALLTDGARWASTHAVRTDVVDTLGAGDTFVARTLVGLLRGELAEDVLAAAAAAASETCRVHGAFGHATAAIAVPASTAVTVSEAGSLRVQTGFHHQQEGVAP